jgi:hypothetical protein
MSDGPHRSLPMRAKWKKVAELAGNQVHDLDDVSAAICIAVEADWRKEVSAGVLKGIREILQNPSLLVEVTIAKFEKVRQMASGKALANFLVDSLIQEARVGKLDEQSVEKVARESMIDRTRRIYRQMEELCLRNTSANKTAKLMARFSEGAKEIGFDTLSRNALKSDRKPLFKKSKHDGLDDGPAI